MIRRGRHRQKSGIRFPILILAAIALAAFVTPKASATILYTVCTGGCTTASSSGSYATTEAQAGSAGLTFPGSPVSFTSANLSAGVYTDPSTGVVFKAYNGASIDTSATVTGGALAQGLSGTSTGIEIDLPANTYAFSMIASAGAFLNAAVAVGSHNVGGSNYAMVISGGASDFFSIVSSTPLTELFIGSVGGGGQLKITSFEDGATAPTPEGPTFLMIATGLFALSVAPRLRSSRIKPREIDPS
jgi:hypothetical protein